MTEKPFAKIYPSDFLNGITDLSHFEIAVYIVVLMRIYDESGPIPDDPKRIARRCHMRLPQCQEALDSLVAEGKLIRENGCLSNKRARKETEDRENTSRSQSERSLSGWQKRKGKTSKNNDTPMPVHQPGNTGDKPIRSQKLEVRGRDARASRLPADWKISDEWKTWALSRGHDNPSLTAEKFKNYWLGASGRNAAKKDWFATWKNWVLRDLEFMGKTPLDPDAPKTETEPEIHIAEGVDGTRWRECMEGLLESGRVTRETFVSWVNPLEFIGEEEGRAQILAPTTFIAARADLECEGALSEAWGARIELTVRKAAA